MGCGPGIGGALMDDLIYPNMWLQEANRNDTEMPDNEESDHDMRKLFPKRTSKKKSGINKISNKGTPEWLAMSVGVFFVGALFTIASYQVYNGNFTKQLSHVSIYDYEPKIFADEPQEGLYDDFRLPNYIIPKSYVLYLSVDIVHKTYSGLIKIEVLCKQDTSQIILHSTSHDINSVQVKSEDNKVIIVKNQFRNTENEMIILSLKKSLTANSKYRLFIGFSNQLHYDFNYGIYLSEYTDGNGIKRDMVSTDFEPTRARKAFPCFDEPGMKAKWKVIVQTQDKKYHAISNMPIDTVNVVDEGKEYLFESTPVMSSYLVVIAVTEYVHRQVISNNGVQIRVFAPAGRSKETTGALEYASYAVDYFADALGINYMLPKLDMFPVTTFSATADETWGNMIFLEQSLLLDPKTSSDANNKSIAEVISHEISHQWFGDLVTMTWWNDLWLKESFATYLQTLPVAEFNPTWDVKTSLYAYARIALAFDSSPYTHPIESKEINTKLLVNSYDSITYNKGSAIVNMLATFIGNEKFLKGLKLYLTRYSYKNANMKQLWEALSEEAGSVDVLKFMNSWVTQSGFPVVTIKRSGDKFLARQERFMYKELSEGTQENVDRTLWHVPLRIKTCGKISQHFLSTVKGEFPVEPGCDPHTVYKANYGSTGYYHVNYEKENWGMLLESMNKNHLTIPAIDRGNLLFDLYSLVSFNQADITLALDFTKYLSAEHYPAGWENGMMIMNRIRHVFYDTKLKKCVEKYTVGKLSPVLDYLKSFTTHNHEQTVLIRILLAYATTYNMKDIHILMENKFLNWVASGGAEKLPVNTRNEILYAGILYGDVYSWEFVNKMRKRATSVAEQRSLLVTLTYTKKKELLQRVVDEAEKTLYAPALQYVCENRHGRDMAWKMVKKLWKQLRTKYKASTGSLDFLLGTCLSVGTKVEDLQEAREFVASTDLGRFKTTADRAIDNIKHNIDFARHESKIISWFRKNYSTCLD